MPESDADVKQLFEQSYDEAFDAWAPFATEAEIDVKFYMNDQWDANLKAYLLDKRRNALVFNRIRRVVKIVTGYERRHRLSIKIGPAGMEDDQVASWMTALVMHTMTRDDGYGYNVISDAFEMGSLVSGVNLIETYLDSRGNVSFRRIPYNRFLLDPSTTEKNLNDCGYITTRDMLSRNQIKSLLPDRAGEIEKLPDENQDTRYQNYPFMLERMGKNLLPYDQFWRKEKRRTKFIVIPELGIDQEWTEDLELFKRMKETQPERMANAELENRWVDECKLVVLVNGVVMHKGPNPLGIDDYNYTAMFGSYWPELDDSALKLQGIVRILRDPQIEFNKRLSQILNIIESQMMSGWIAEQNAVVNRDSLMQTAQGKAIFVHDGKMDALKKIPPGDIPQGLFQLNTTLDKLIVEIPGINEELLGTENKDIAGVLSKLRQGAGLTSLQDWFDNLSMAKRHLGKLVARIIQKNYSRRKIERIINKQITPEFFSRDIMEYDCIVQEGLLTDSQRELYYEELKALYRMAAEAGQPGAIPFGAIIKAAPIQLRDELQAEIKEAERQRQQANTAQEEDRELLRKLQQSQIAKDLAQAEERHKEAGREKAQEFTEWLEAVEKIRGLGIDNASKVIEMIRSLKDSNDQSQQDPQIAQNVG
ncbi:MAG TPA: hypothetical protein ENH94_00320 [Phycisphaerales bacterium]|nr:hypothetical protein [Phycisphaerales bacterium]